MPELQEDDAAPGVHGVEVYSVSTDTHFVHKAWHDASETIKKIQGFADAAAKDSSIKHYKHQ